MENESSFQFYMSLVDANDSYRLLCLVQSMPLDGVVPRIVPINDLVSSSSQLRAFSLVRIFDLPFRKLTNIEKDNREY